MGLLHQALRHCLGHLLKIERPACSPPADQTRARSGRAATAILPYLQPPLRVLKAVQRQDWWGGPGSVFLYQEFYEHIAVTPHLYIGLWIIHHRDVPPSNSLWSVDQKGGSRLRTLVMTCTLFTPGMPALCYWSMKNAARHRTYYGESIRGR